MILLDLILILANFAFAGWQTGDVIFQQSQSAQSKAISEAQGSAWTHMGILQKVDAGWVVLEAVQPVKATPLSQWVARGRGGQYIVKRVAPQYVDLSSVAKQNQLLRQFEKYRNKNYDLFFEWSDETIYCSELVFKMYFGAFGFQPGRIQHFADLNLTGKYIRQMIAERERLKGSPISLEEPVVTPVSILEDSRLEIISEFQLSGEDSVVQTLGQE